MIDKYDPNTVHTNPTFKNIPFKKNEAIICFYHLVLTESKTKIPSFKTNYFEGHNLSLLGKPSTIL